MKTFNNGKMVPLTLPLLVNVEFVTNFKGKAYILNSFFAEQYRVAT